MVLNYIWIGFFVVAFILALAKLIFQNNLDIFPALVKSIFDIAEASVMDIALPLVGVMAFWLGIMKLAEKGGAINYLSKAIAPFFKRIFPEIPQNHPASGSMVMNFAANMLGLDNAATPMGLKAMTFLQELNPKKDTASNAQIMFLVLNTSGLTLIPVSIMALRSTQGAQDPSDVFLPLLLSTFFSTLGGLIVTSLIQKINLLNKVVLVYLVGVSVLVASFIYFLSGLNSEQMEMVSKTISNVILLGVIILFIALASFKKINVFESFVEGAKEGFEISVKIIPYLIALLSAIAVFRASGALDIIVDGIRYVVLLFTDEAQFVDALPTALMRPLSGSGAKALAIDTFNTFGIDSFAGRLASTFQGATETTFYVIAVYFGSVGIKRTRYAVSVGLFADLIGAISAICIAYLFWA